MQTAFVTGSTGLLGNNLVRLLAGRGVRVKALARSREKAAKQFAGIPVERYLAAGRHMTMDDLFPLLAEASGVTAPTRRIPLTMLRALAAGYELYAGVTGRPVLVSQASVKLLAQEADRSHYDHAKSERELDCTFRPAAETLADTVAWYRANGDLPARPSAPGRDGGRGRHDRRQE